MKRQKSHVDNVYYGAYVAACLVLGWLMSNSVSDRARPIDRYRPVSYVQPQAPRPERNPAPICPKGQRVSSVTLTKGLITGVTCAPIKVKP